MSERQTYVTTCVSDITQCPYQWEHHLFCNLLNQRCITDAHVPIQFNLFSYCCVNVVVILFQSYTSTNMRVCFCVKQIYENVCMYEYECVRFFLPFIYLLSDYEAFNYLRGSNDEVLYNDEK